MKQGTLSHGAKFQRGLPAPLCLAEYPSHGAHAINAIVDVTKLETLRLMQPLLWLALIWTIGITPATEGTGSAKV